MLFWILFHDTILFMIICIASRIPGTYVNVEMLSGTLQHHERLSLCRVSWHFH